MDSWSCRQVEDSRVSVSELLVAPDVLIHWEVRLHLQPVHVDQGPKAAPSRRASPLADPQCTVGHNQGRLYH